MRATTDAVLYEVAKADVAPLLATRPDLATGFEQRLVLRRRPESGFESELAPATLGARIRAFFSL